MSDFIIKEGMLTTLGSVCFKGCMALPAIHLPDGITEIPFSAFQGCTALATIHFEAQVGWQAGEHPGEKKKVSVAVTDPKKNAAARTTDDNKQYCAWVRA